MGRVWGSGIWWGMLLGSGRGGDGHGGLGEGGGCSGKLERVGNGMGSGRGWGGHGRVGEGGELHGGVEAGEGYEGVGEDG